MSPGRRERDPASREAPPQTVTDQSVQSADDPSGHDGQGALTGALAMAARGWPVFPVAARGKTPTVKFSETATTDPKAIAAELAGTDLNYGIHMGKAGLVVLDEDQAGGLDEAAAAHGGLVEPTFTVQTSKGRHMYYRVTDGFVRSNTAGGFAEHGVDVRGAHDSYVVGPGSTHHTGVIYTVIDDRDPVVLPDWCVALIGTKPPTSVNPAATANPFDAGAERGLAALPEVIRGPQPGKGGQRHQQLVSFANSLRARRTPHAEAVGLMKLAWQRCEQPPACIKESPWEDAAKILEHAFTRPEGTSQEQARAAVRGVVQDDGCRLTLPQVDVIFRRWLGEDYDTDALHAVLAAAAVEQLDGDPLWLLLVSGSGNAKTETVQALDGIGATVTSTVSSLGALLSATSKKEQTADATGGLLRKIGDRGVLVIKDVTSILSMGREMRGEVLGALREVYDGHWERNVGTDGGRSLDWVGRIVLVGAVTTAWDTAHAVISAMGDRFVLVRMDSTTGRTAAGRQAIANTGSETEMRAELADAVRGVLATINPIPEPVTAEETEVLLAAADLVTLARTAVEYDYRGDVTTAHAPEMPTRFAKQLAQVVRGSVALGMGRDDALALAVRCARDSMPPLRLQIVDDVAAHPGSSTADVRKRIGKPRATVDRQLQALHMLGVIDVEETEIQWSGREGTRWSYTITDGINPQAISTRNVCRPPTPDEKRDEKRAPLGAPTHKSGTDPVPAAYPECGHPRLFDDPHRTQCEACRIAAGRAGAA